MRSVRPATLALLATLALSGCRTAGVDNLARRDPAVPRPTLDARAVIAKHNRNAERIESLEAKPSLTVYQGRQKLPVDGMLALERPRNFSLAIRHTMGEVADIGSNDDEFWFWVKNDKDKSVYYCNHEDVANTELAAAMQPDWIVEALGLRVIPESEIGDFTLARGKTPDSLVLTHRPSKAGGDTVVRMTVISEATQRIKEHRLYASDGNTLLARATVESYMPVKPSDRPEETVELPQKLRLEWFREKLVLEAEFSNDATTQVNLEFPEDRKNRLFVEEPRKGYQRVNLASVAAPRNSAAPRDESSEIRETRPAPPAGVELGKPAPVDIDGAFRTDRAPLALTAEGPVRRSLKDQLVPPPMARAPEMEYARPNRSWRPATTTGYEQ